MTRPRLLIVLLPLLMAIGCHGPGSQSDVSHFLLTDHKLKLICNAAGKAPTITLQPSERRLAYQRRGIGPGSWYELVSADSGIVRVETVDNRSEKNISLVAVAPGETRITYRDWLHHTNAASFAVRVLRPR
ncbi:MAG: hypothetical protein WCS94_20745 [Verrucomicrobiota bacterium]